MKHRLKQLAFALATIVVSPMLLMHSLGALLLGRDRALEGSSQLLSLVPGLLGQYLRRAFLCRVLDHCHPSVTVEFGALLSKAGARLGENVYIGPRCMLGLVDLEKDVLLGPGVSVPSGGNTHGTADPSQPIREQAGERRCVRIGAGTWVGSNAVVMADVGPASVVGAGAVVTKPLPGGVVAGGVPARTIRERGSE
jgi:acetyltransferase-like isoleucine patch superfamily enzyme